MREIYIKSKTGLLPIGKQGENLTTRVIYPRTPESGQTVTVFVKRNGDTAAYPASNTEVTNTKVIWIVTSTDTDKQGKGQVQYRFSDAGTGEVVKTDVFDFVVDKAIDAEVGPVPDPYETWLDSLTDLAEQVQADAERAEASAQSIQTMTVEVETLDESASATASWDDGTLSLGIPKGDTGQQGPKGDAAVLYVIEFSAGAIVYDATKAAGSQFTPASGRLRASFYKIEGATRTAYISPSASTWITTPDDPSDVSGERSDAYNVRWFDIIYPEYMSGNSQVFVYMQTPNGTVEAAIPVISCGPKGDKGDTGAQGPKGETGATGPQGPAGSDASVTAQNIASALGYTPADSAKAQSLVGITELTSSDYNTLTAVGEYYVLAANVGNVSNKPVNSRQRITVEGTLGGGTTYIRQTVRPYDSEDVYIRHTSNGGTSWSAWTRMTGGNATTSVAGLMSPTDKSKVDALWEDYSDALEALG